MPAGVPPTGTAATTAFARGSITATESEGSGILAASMQRWSDAEQHFDEALAMNARMGARPWLAQTQHDYARMLLARGASADRSRAGRLLDDARSTYGELGMKAYEASAAAPVPAR